MVRLASALVATVLAVAIGVQAGPGVMDILKANIRGKVGSHGSLGSLGSFGSHGYGHSSYPSDGYGVSSSYGHNSGSLHYPSPYGKHGHGYGSDPYAYGDSSHNPYGYDSHHYNDHHVGHRVGLHGGYHGGHHGGHHNSHHSGHHMSGHSRLGHGHNFGHGHGHSNIYGDSSSAASAAAVSGGAAAAAAAMSSGAHSRHGLGHGHHDHHKPHYSHDTVHTPHGYMSSEHFEHNHGPTEYISGAVSGTFGNDGHGLEKSSYQRSTNSLQSKERGHIDDDHYYNAQSYGKTMDDNYHEAYDKDHEDYEPTPYGFRKKKRKENYVKTHFKTSSESGSGVIAKDKHHSGYSKSTNKLMENVDEKTHRNVGGVLVTDHSSTRQHIDDGDDDFYDNKLGHLGHHHGGHLHGISTGGHGGGAAASASAGPGGVSTSAAAGGH